MRILMYSHDSYGLGHLRRTLALAEAFVEYDSETNVLILTGSTISGAYRMSKGIDLIKLPSAVKVDNGAYEADRMSVNFEALKDLRTGLIRSAAEIFDPDVFVVDKAPLGMKGEVEETLRFLREERPGTRTILGLRDVMDDPEYVRKSWERKNMPESIEKYYDLVLVYGPREVYDPLPLYGLSKETLDKTHYVGYVGKRQGLQAVSDLPFEPGYVLVTAGGGGDGFELVKSYLEGLAISEPDFDSLIVTGPLMDDEQKRELEKLAKGVRARVLEFRADMENIIQGAGAVVAMGGYNTTTELLASRKPSVIVPRVKPRVEQLIRAERLAEMGLIDMIHPDDLSPELMRAKVEDLLESRRSPRVRAIVDFSGAKRAVEMVWWSVHGERQTAMGA
ncbi:MAG: glycosyltransferase family protein [Rubrobacteraceae bacterium]